MSDIRFQVSGRGAREIAAKFGAMIEGEFGRRAETQEKEGTFSLTLPAALLTVEDATRHRGLAEKLSRLIGVARWEYRNGIEISVRGANDDKGAWVRLDEAEPSTLLEMAAKK